MNRRNYRLITPALLVLPLLAACSTGPRGTQSTVATETSATAVTNDPGKANPESLTISFNSGGATLSQQADQQLDTAARLYRDAKPEIMIVSGHSDAVGQEYSNLLLSAKRADIVKRALVDRGVPADRLQIVAIGAAQPVPGVPPSRSTVVTWR